MIIRGIDIGYGNTKYVLSDSFLKITCRAFPSIAPLYNRSFDVFAEEKIDSVIVNVDGNNYAVGNESDLEAASVKRTFHDDYIETAGYKALFLGALYYINQPVIDVLVMGLPVNLMSRKNDVIRMFRGKHALPDGVFCQVNEVLVIPQPLGGFIEYAAKEQENSLTDIRTLLIDPGFYTLDWLLTKGLKPVKGRSGSSRSGMSLVIKHICKTISDDIGRVYDNIHNIDRALVAGKSDLRVFGQTIDLKPHILRAAPVIQEAVDVMYSGLAQIDDIDQIIITGGGGELFSPFVKQRFIGYPIKLASEAMYSNVKGFYLAGRKFAKSRSRS